MCIPASKAFIQRPINRAIFSLAKQFGFTDLQCRIIAGRTSERTSDLEQILFPALKNLHHPHALKDCMIAVEEIASCLRRQNHIGILTDYDVDGICSHVVIIRALRAFGADPSKLLSLIGHRMQDGYGISDNLVQRILSLPQKPQLIITADCGSSDEPRIARLREHGISVIVTDHHAIPSEGIPESATATVNPTREDCAYPDKFISGCMVSWLLMCALRMSLIESNYLPESTPKLTTLLDFVALSTVADAVSFCSASNRAVVSSGLTLINQMQRPCWFALNSFLRKSHASPFTAEDLAFQIAPRINARSRMADPYAALNFFMADTLNQAEVQLKKLEKNNDERKKTEKEMMALARREALRQVELGRSTVVVSHDDFHAGVQGIVASRLVEFFGRPSVVLSPSGDSESLSGSARSIPEIHIRDALQAIHDLQPDIFLSFGGHRGAAGLKIKRGDTSRFSMAFEQQVVTQLSGASLGPSVMTDGDLPARLLQKKTVLELQALEPYGREFDEPMFEGSFKVRRLQLVGAEPVHLSLTLTTEEGKNVHGIWFRAIAQPGEEITISENDLIRCAYKLKINTFRGSQNMQLLIDHACRIDDR